MDKGNKWVRFILIILSLAIVALWIRVEILNPSLEEYEYITINLDNKNIWKYEVYDYICSDNVHTSYYRFDKSFYASTWRDGNIPHSKGSCFVKIKRGHQSESEK